ncbi:trigger factor [Dehalococcoidia bacterium]|nr:trigger factor [Dehalococcoidia bacterium]
MKITQDEVVDSETVIHIELEDPDLAPYLDRGYRRVVQRLAIPGFRKGKAPRQVVETFVGRESLLNEVLDSMVVEVTDEAVKEQDLDATGLPKIEMVELDPFTLKATVPLQPEVDLGTYRDIRIPYESSEVTDEDIDGRLEELRHSQATWEPVERAVELGDLVTLRISGNAGGQTIIDEEDTTYFLDKDAGRPLPGFAEKLAGLEAEVDHKFTLEIPEDFQDSAIAGQEAVFSVQIKEIKERLLPDLDDAFARSLPESHEGMEVLREAVEQALKTEGETNTNRKYEEEVVAALLDGSTFALSPLMIEHEVKHIEENQDVLLQRLSIRKDDYLRSIGKTEEEQAEEVREQAEQRLRRTFAINKLAEVETVEVADDEVEERLQEVQVDPQQAEQVHDTGDRRESVERILRYEKAVSVLVDIAKGQAWPETDGDLPLESEETKLEGADYEDDPNA